MALVFRHRCAECGYPVSYRAARKGYVHIKDKGACPLVAEKVIAQQMADR